MKPVIKHLKSNRYLYLLVVIAVVGYWRWLSFRIFSNGDWGYLFHQTAVNYLKFPIWDSLTGFGQVDVTSWRLPLNVLYGVFGFFNQDKNISEKIIVFWPTIIAGVVGSYLLIRRFFSEKAAFIGALIFNFNTYFLAGPTHILLYSSASFGVLALNSYLEGLNTKKAKHYIITALFLFISGFFDLRGLYLVLFVLLGLFFAYAAPPLKEKTTRGNIIKMHALLGCIVIGLFAFWALGVYEAGSLTSNDVLGRDLFGDQYWSLTAAIALFHPFWTFMRTEWFVAHSPSFYFFIIPATAIAGVLLNRRNKAVLLFLLIALVGIFLAKQSDAPASGVYQFLYDKLPGFNAFREATKFYFLIAISYAILVASFIDGIWRTPDPKLVHAKWAIFGIISLTMLINLVPLLTGTVDSMFQPKTVPADYVVYNRFIQKNEGDGRTLWFPITSRWAIYTAGHANINAIDYASLEKFPAVNSDPREPIEIKLQQWLGEYSQSIGDTNIKYFIVPISDRNQENVFQAYGDSREFYLRLLNNVPWLHRINIGTKELAVYENKNYRPYIAADTKLMDLSASGDQNALYSTATSRLNQSLDYNVPKIGDKQFGGVVKDIFSDITPSNSNIRSGLVTATTSIQAPATLYENVNVPNISYAISNDAISLTADYSSNLLLNGKTLPTEIGNNKKVIGTTPIVASKQYYLELDDQLIPIDTSVLKRTFGTASKQVQILATDKNNLVANGSFEAGLWQDKVNDCNGYDKYSLIGMDISKTDSTDGGQSLQLSSLAHIACTQTNPIPVQSGAQYMLSFDFKTKFTSQLSYQVIFDDPAHTTIDERNGTGTEQWRSVHKLIGVPKAASHMTLRLNGLPPDNAGTEYAATNFDNVRLVTASSQGVPQLNIASDYKSQAIPSGTNQFVLKDRTADSTNLIPNGSLEEGLWQKTVGDCNAYNDKPVISMTDSSNASDGKKSLELDAKSHVACTGPNPLTVQEGDTYLLAFDYQSPNTDVGSYYVSFNDPQNTFINGDLVATKKWQTFNKVIRIPAGATQLTLIVYARSNDSALTITDRYDNFKLMQIPDVQNKFILVEQQPQLAQPKVLTFNQESPTAKQIHVSGTTTSFYLTMAETYHPKWRLDINNNKIKGLGAWLPWAKPDAIPDADHFKLNDFENGWYVDVDKLCRQQQLCTQNADGSYNLELVAEFTPQRWFYAGLIVSGLTLAGCLGYLGATWRRRRKQPMPPAAAPPRKLRRL